jgi:hypothetical protein
LRTVLPGSHVSTGPGSHVPTGTPTFPVATSQPQTEIPGSHVPNYYLDATHIYPLEGPPAQERQPVMPPPRPVPQTALAEIRLLLVSVTGTAENRRTGMATTQSLWLAKFSPG